MKFFQVKDLRNEVQSWKDQDLSQEQMLARMDQIIAKSGHTQKGNDQRLTYEYIKDQIEKRGFTGAEMADDILKSLEGAKPKERMSASPLRQKLEAMREAEAEAALEAAKAAGAPTPEKPAAPADAKPPAMTGDQTFYTRSDPSMPLDPDSKIAGMIFNKSIALKDLDSLAADITRLRQGGYELTEQDHAALNKMSGGLRQYPGTEEFRDDVDRVMAAANDPIQPAPDAQRLRRAPATQQEPEKPATTIITDEPLGPAAQPQTQPTTPSAPPMTSTPSATPTQFSGPLAIRGTGNALVFENHDDVLKAQKYMKQLGIECGPLDGIEGPLTRGGLFKYMEAKFPGRDLSKITMDEVLEDMKLKVEGPQADPAKAAPDDAYADMVARWNRQHPPEYTIDGFDINSEPESAQNKGTTVYVKASDPAGRDGIFHGNGTRVGADQFNAEASKLEAAQPEAVLSNAVIKEDADLKTSNTSNIPIPT